jgi:hypothetical protein
VKHLLVPLAQYKFHAGPYEAPKVKKGDKLYDERKGEVVVVRYTKAPIRWPGRKTNTKVGVVPILCGDLVRAVCEEEEETVARYWGVTKYVVDQWKQAIAGASKSTEVFVLLALKRNDPEFRRKHGYKD